jgi:hypothetical protein
MLVEEESKNVTEVNPDALEAVFDEAVFVEEEEVTFFETGDDEDVDEIDIAFQANDEEYW